MAKMTFEEAQDIITQASGKPVVVQGLQIDDAGPSITVNLDNGDIWTVSPGPGWHLTVAGPGHKEQLIYFRREEAPSPSP